jgi:4-amino-4-deoxy-L-arabinose transferase-like glycosyltransferase
MLPVFVAFSFISGKQPHYLVPLFPAFALLTARVLADRLNSRVGLPALLAAALGGALLLTASGKIEAASELFAGVLSPWPVGVLMLVAGATWVAGRRGVPPGLNLAVLGVATLALVQGAAMRSFDTLYDIKPMALAIKQVQDDGRPVANAARYHAQYQFLGRLEAPLIELQGAELTRWLAAHPEAYVVMYLKDRQNLDTIPARHKQVYRRGAAILVDAKTAASVLAAAAD